MRIVLLCLTLLALGCGDSEKVQEAEVSHMAFYLKGELCGKMTQTIQKMSHEGEPRLQFNQIQELVLRRGGNVNRIQISLAGTETPDGQLLRCESFTRLGQSEFEVSAVRSGEKLKVTSGEAVREMPFNPKVLGPLGIDLKLKKNPMQPSEQRAYQQYLPVQGSLIVVTITLASLDWEETELLDGTARLLRVKTTTHDSQGRMLERSTLWLDEQGDAQKIRLDSALGIVGYQVEEPPAQIVDPETDLLVLTKVPLEEPLRSHPKQVVYEVALDSANPAEMFANSLNQQVIPIDEHRARLVVEQLSLADVFKEASATSSKPPAESLEPNHWVDFGDFAIQKLCDGLPDTISPKLISAAHSRVRATITNPDYSQLLSRASEVVQSKQGDCTEHAILLAALLRAKKVPARVVVGLVYVHRPEPHFNYHMWNEAYLNGVWVPIDAVNPDPVAGPTHLKLAHSYLEGTSGIQELTAASAKVVGQLKLKIESQK